MDSSKVLIVGFEHADNGNTRTISEICKKYENFFPKLFRTSLSDLDDNFKELQRGVKNLWIYQKCSQRVWKQITLTTFHVTFW